METAAGAADPQYRFVMSEIPHLITMMEFEPQRVAELKQRMAEGRVELVNAFVLEPTVNLSGREALQFFEPLIPQAKRAFMRSSRNPKLLGRPPS